MKKLLITASVVLLLLCSFALVVSAEDCAHKDNWEVKFGEADILGNWEAINVCPDCGLVLDNEFCEPLITSRGYSYYVDSFSQSYYVNRAMIKKYEEYTGEKFDLGLVAGISEQLGFAPVNPDGTLSNENGVWSSFSDSNFSIIDIKVANLPSTSYDTKVTACMFAIRGGSVAYIDGNKLGQSITGVSYSGIVDAIENDETPTGIGYNSEFRKLSANEMEILMESYWMSNHNSEYAVRRTTENTYQKFASTRMFTRDELPSGSYVVVADGWGIRPEVWEINDNGEIVLNKNRPGNKGTGTYTIEELWQDTASGKSNYKYMAFNVSEGKSGYLTDMSPKAISEVLQIYVPSATKVATNTYEHKNVSVEGMQLLEWTTDNFLKGKYHNNNSSSSTIGTDSSFCTTMLFTKETLPVGSVIEINDGWMYRAEYWKKATGNSRGPMVSTYRFVVTEEFWSGISERAFNISETSGDSLSSYTWDEVASAFKIYVPAN